MLGQIKWNVQKDKKMLLLLECISCVSGCEWAAPCTMLLIATYAQLEYKFKNPWLKQKEVWKEVAIVMSREGYSFTGDECAKKWANLQIQLVTYSATQ